MRRVLVAALLLAVPVFAGFECTVEVEPWVEGDTCDYWLDYPSDNICNTDTEVFYCSSDGYVVAWDCAAACDGGYCDYDAATGGDWCMCPDWQWAPGYTCDYFTQYNQSTCDVDTLTYCGADNIIAAISCQAQCDATVGAGSTASCGVQPETGYNGCICEIATCTYADYCYDSLWLVQCSGGAEAWTDCNVLCTGTGYTKGVCDANACLCG